MANEDSDYRERLRSMVIHIANHGEHIDQEGKTKTETKMYHCLPAGNEILGSGSYGYVMRARLVREKDLCECPDGDVALKFLNNEPSEDRMSELRLMLNIDHDNVVKCLAVGYCTDSSGDPRLKGSPKREACIMMEYCDGGTLENFIAANPLSEERLFDYTSQLSKGLHYLHEQEKDSGILLVFHEDLKTQNILLKDKIGSVLKIAGLDNFKKLERQQTLSTDLKRKMGTLALMSPEMIAWEKDKPILRVGRATDIWSLGCVILECFQGGGPFNFRKTDNSFVDSAELSDDEIMTIVDEGGVPDIPDTMPVALRRLVESCLSRDPSERPNALALRLYAENLKVFEENTVQRNLVLLQKTKARKKYLLLPDKMPYFINSTRIVEYVFAGERGSYVLMEGYYADVLLVHMKEKDWSNDSTGPDLKCTVVILRHPLQARGAEELQHLITLDHQNVGKYYSLGCTHSNNDESMGDLSLDWRYILMENYSGQCMTNHPSLQDAIQAESYAHQLILGMNYINARGIVHGCLNPQHVLLSGDRLKITGFQRFRCVPHRHEVTRHDRHGEIPLLFMSPEMMAWSYSTYVPGGTTDSWSVGCLLVYILCKGQLNYRTVCGEILKPLELKPHHLRALLHDGGSIDMPSTMTESYREFIGWLLRYRCQNTRGLLREITGSHLPVLWSSQINMGTWSRTQDFYLFYETCLNFRQLDAQIQREGESGGSNDGPCERSVHRVPSAPVQTHMSIAEEEPDLYSESHKCDHPYIRMEKHYGEQDYLVISSPDGVVHRFDAGTPEMMLHSILSDAIFCSQFSGNVRTLTLPATFSTDEQCARQKEAMFIYGNFGFQVSLKQQFQTMTRIADFQHENIVRHFTFGIQRLTDVSPTSRNNYGLLLEHGFRSDPGIMFGQTFLDLHTLVGFAVLSSKTILKYTLQLLDAVEYLHEREPRFIIGRLKTSSIAVTPDRQSVKIFDLLAPLYRPSTYLKSEHSVRSVLKTHGYFHPLLFEKFSPDQHEDAREEQHELVFTKGSDFWAFGCVVIDMISGGNLQHIDRKGVYLKKDIRRMKFAEEMILGGQPEIPETSPHFLRSFCEECFNRYPEVELTAAHLRTVLSHELLADKI